MDTSEILKTRPTGNFDQFDYNGVVEKLNEILANEYCLFTKTLNYHWNVTGSRFHSLHQFLEVQYKELLSMMDSIAERVRMLGGVPMSTVSAMKATMTMDEVNGQCLTSDEMLEDLFSSNISIQVSINNLLRTESKLDYGTNDFLVSILQKHESTSWMLKSHLQ